MRDQKSSHPSGIRERTVRMLQRATMLALLAAAPTAWAQSGVTVSPTAQTVLGGGGFVTASVTAAAGTAWTVSTSASWITLLTTSGTGNGTVQYQVAQNSGGSSQAGAITVQSAGGSASIAVTEQPMAAGGPTAGIGNSLVGGSLPGQASQTLTITAGSPNGPGYLSMVRVIVNNNGIARYACQMNYYPQYNTFYFIEGDVTTAYTLGTSGQVNGLHCQLNLGSSSVVIDPSSSTAGVTLNLALTLQPSAVGAQGVFVTAGDLTYTYNDFLTSLASWTAYPELTTNLPAVSMTAPAAVSSQVLHYKFSDGNGYTYMIQMEGLLGAASTGQTNPCSFEYDPPDTIQLWQVVNGAPAWLGYGAVGGAWSYPQTNGIIGAAGACSIDLNQSKLYTSTDGSYTLQDPNSATYPDLYLDMWTGLDTSVQATLPFNIYLSATDKVSPLATTPWPGCGPRYNPLIIATASPLPGGTVGVAYSTTLAAGGGSGAYTNWAGVSGSFPFGLSINASSGVISGTPSIAGNYTFTVQVTDSSSNTAGKSFSLNVNPALTITSGRLCPAARWGWLTLGL